MNIVEKLKKILFILLLLTSAQAYAQEPNVVVPNVFTPNGDGDNDVFSVRVDGFSELECVVYNRYGAQVYRFEGINGFWDGRTQTGLICVSGVYTYLIKASNADGSSETYQGNIHLVR